MITFPEMHDINSRYAGVVASSTYAALEQVHPSGYFSRATTTSPQDEIEIPRKTIRVGPLDVGLVFYLQRGTDRKFTTTTVEFSPQQILEIVSPFEELSELLDEESTIQNLIGQVKTSANICSAGKLGNRLEVLFEAAKEENPDKVMFSSASLRNFVAFLQSESHLKYPDVVVSPSGNIRAQWSAARNKHFAAEFLPNEDVRFVLFTPHPDRTVRMSGIASINALMETVQPHGVLSWASDHEG